MSSTASPGAPNGRFARAALLFACGLALAGPASTATYKCTVGGKTVYQQTPCEAGAASETLRIQATPNTGVMSAGQAAKATQQIERDGVRLAREGFERLKGGRIDEFVANLCPRERQAYNNPTIKGSLKSQGERLAAGKFMLVPQPRDVTTSSLRFDALQNPMGAQDGRVPPQKIGVTADFRTDLGQLCLRSMSVWGGS
jgi:hypothetical protein